MSNPKADRQLAAPTLLSGGIQKNGGFRVVTLVTGTATMGSQADQANLSDQATPEQQPTATRFPKADGPNTAPFQLLKTTAQNDRFGRYTADKMS